MLEDAQAANANAYDIAHLIVKSANAQHLIVKSANAQRAFC